MRQSDPPNVDSADAALDSLRLPENDTDAVSMMFEFQSPPGGRCIWKSASTTA